MGSGKSKQIEAEHKTETTELGPSSRKSSTAKYLAETVKQLQAENEKLKLALLKPSRIPSGKIGIAFIIPGILSLIISIYVDSSTLAFVGLGLTFWGSLFYFVRPIKYVKSDLLDSTAIPSYSTVDRIVKNLNYRGKSFYIPAYSKDVYLPQHLKGLKDMIVFISADINTGMPSIEEIAQGRFLLENPKGVSIIPPGLGLLTIFENELKTELVSLNLDELCDSLPQLILKNSLAEEVKMKIEQNQVYLKMVGSMYKSLYEKEKNLESVHSLGCPVISAVACAVAKATRKVVTLQKDKVSHDNRTVEVWLKIVGT